MKYVILYNGNPKLLHASVTNALDVCVEPNQIKVHQTEGVDRVTQLRIWLASLDRLAFPDNLVFLIFDDVYFKREYNYRVLTPSAFCWTAEYANKDINVLLFSNTSINYHYETYELNLSRGNALDISDINMIVLRPKGINMLQGYINDEQNPDDIWVTSQWTARHQYKSLQ